MKFHFVNQLSSFGVRTQYQPWQTHLTRKINLSSIIGMCSVTLALAVFLLAGYRDVLFECLTVIFLVPLVLIINNKFGYIAAGYLFTFIGCFFFYFLCVKMGLGSYGFLCYVPFNIALVQMFARKETFFHLLMMIIMCVLSVVLVIISYKFGFFYRELSPQIISTLKYTNIFFSLVTTMAFLMMISSESMKQENQLKTALQQKEILLAELFHRVKNNLNIVNSLLNLKKGSVQSAEAEQALEECRSLIFSMSLVHNKIYNQDKIDNLNFSEYLHDLGKDLVNSLGGTETKLLINTPRVNLDITHAIPCGLIINELMTNSFKHGRMSGKQLQIRIDLETTEDQLTLSYSDNGPGISAQASDSGSVGLGLIRSLAEQIDGKYSFFNNPGMGFTISFPYSTNVV